MIQFFISSIIITLTISSRRLLQTATNPIPNSIPNPVLPQLPGNNIPVINFNPSLIPQQISPYITGFWQQQCLAITSDMLCQTVGQIVSDAGTGTVECSVSSSCCACQQVTCGYEPPPNNQYCDSIKVGAPNALYGVKQVAIRGEVDGSGAVLDCGARGACASTYVIGEWVNTIICGGPDACRDSIMDIQQSKGIVCSTRSCIGTTFNLLSNRGGAISCAAPEACMSAIINVVGNIQNIVCGGIRACKDAKITLTNPMEHFQLSCGGQASCEGLSVDLIITGPAATTGCLTNGQPDVIEWKGITCGSLGSCQGLTLNVINNGCRPVRMEDFICIAGQSCTGSNFNFNAGSSPYPLQLQNCACGLSCNQATGVDLCYNNVHVLECLDVNSCSNQPKLLTNIANGFLLLCPNPGTCNNLGLTISIAGASQNIIQRITGFDCSGFGACSGLTVDIQNMQILGTGAAIEVVVGAVICAQEFSCDGATFITGPNVKISNVFCALENSCNNCVIMTDRNDPNPRPCNPNPVQLPIITPAPITPAPVDPVLIDPLPVDPVTIDPNQVPIINPIPDIPSIPSIPNANTPSTPTCIEAYGQCGGLIENNLPYRGPTCCIDGYICTVVSQQYAQCDPAPPVNNPATTTTAPPAVLDPVPVAVDPVPPSPADPTTTQVLAGSAASTTTTRASIPIPDIPSIPSIPDLPIPPAAVPIDIQQTGGAPAPPQIDQIPVDPITDPVVPVVQTGGIVIETGNTNNNNNGGTAIDVQQSPQTQGTGSGAIIPPSVV